MEEIKSNPKNIIFATLTFSEESLKKLEYDEKEPNKAPIVTGKQIGRAHV